MNSVADKITQKIYSQSDLVLGIGIGYALGVLMGLTYTLCLL